MKFSENLLQNSKILLFCPLVIGTKMGMAEMWEYSRGMKNPWLVIKAYVR